MPAADAWRSGELRLEIHPDCAGNVARFELRLAGWSADRSSARQRRQSGWAERAARPAPQERSARPSGLVIGCPILAERQRVAEELARATARVTRRR